MTVLCKMARLGLKGQRTSMFTLFLVWKALGLVPVLMVGVAQGLC